MKIRIEGQDGNPRRFKLYDVDSGKKIGLVQSVELNMTIDTAVMRFERMPMKNKGEFNGGVYFSADPNDIKLSPWLRGTLNEKNEYIFETMPGEADLTFENWLKAVGDEGVLSVV